MSIKANSLIGLPVITINDGQKVNTIKDVVYDGNTNQVTAFVVDEKGWFSVAKIILIQDIKSIGKDAILIEDESKIVTADSQVDQSIALTANDDNFLDTNNVITQSGTKLGRVTDIYFNEITGKLEAIEVSQGFLKNVVSGTKKIAIDDIITVGKQNLIVEDVVEENIEQQGQKQGLNKTFEDTKVTAATVAAQTSDKIHEAAETVKAKTVEVVHSDGVQNAIHKTQEVAGDLKDKATDAFAKTKDSIDAGEAEANLKNDFANVKDKVIDLPSIAKDKIAGVAAVATDKVQTTTTQTQEKILQDRINYVLGKQITDPLIYGKDHKIIASKGDIITPRLIEIARSNDVLDRLLGSIA
jgi:uncharacterized protein YrrD